MYCTECGANVPDKSRYCISCGAYLGNPATQPHTPDQRVPQPFTQGPQPYASYAPYQQVPVPNAQVPQVGTNKKRRLGGITLLLCFLCFLLVVVFEIVGYVIGYALKIDSSLTGTLGSAIGGILSVMILGGAKWLVPKREVVETSLKEGWVLLALSLSLLAFSLVSCLMAGETIVESGWLLRFISIGLLCVGIGISEETMFRALIFGGILDVSGRKRQGLFVAAAIVSVLFGLAHINWGSLDYSNALEWVQAILKVTQTGMLSLFFCGLVLKTKSFVGAALLHGLSDFILMIPAFVLLNGTPDIEYVSSGTDAVYMVVFYAVLIAFYLPLAYKGIQDLKQTPLPAFGPFHKE